MRVEFESGCVANFTASRVSTERVRKLRFFEPRQYVSIDYARRELLVIRIDAVFFFFFFFFKKKNITLTPCHLKLPSCPLASGNSIRHLLALHILAFLVFEWCRNFFFF